MMIRISDGNYIKKQHKFNVIRKKYKFKSLALKKENSKKKITTA
jgi:hypothetical protein